MTFDHINTFIFDKRYWILFEFGRLVMPIFAFVLAYNLARANKTEVHKRVISRLLVAGLCAMPFFMAINSAVKVWFPLNIMFSLMVSTICIYLFAHKKHTILVLCVLIGGTLTEYFYPAILFTIFSWQYCHTGQKKWLLWMLLIQFPIGLLNGSMTGALSIAIIYAASKLKFNFEIPRYRTFFYSYYPAHLTIIWLFKNF